MNSIIRFDVSEKFDIKHSKTKWNFQCLSSLFPLFVQILLCIHYLLRYHCYHNSSALFAFVSTFSCYFSLFSFFSIISYVSFSFSLLLLLLSSPYPSSFSSSLSSPSPSFPTSSSPSSSFSSFSNYRFNYEYISILSCRRFCDKYINQQED